MGSHLTNHIQNHTLRSEPTLYVIGVISNFARYQSRYRLAREWISQMQATQNIQLCLVELALGDRAFEITEANNPWHLQLRTDQWLFHKESMINLAVRHLLPIDWKYMAWIDMDVQFQRPDWPLETLQQLQIFSVVQPFSDAMDMGPNGEVLSHFKSFAFQHRIGSKLQKWSGQPYQFGHCGFAWACRRDFWEATQGLIDWTALGSADYHMAFSMLGDGDGTVHGKMNPNFALMLHDWETKAIKITHKQIGCVMGTIQHSFHGAKAARGYRSRWDILVRDGFNPATQIIHDSAGLVRLVGNKVLEQDIYQYFMSRKEDGTEPY